LNAHMDWIVSAAHERRDLGLAEGDLFQEGALGLMEAIRGFESAAGVDFESASKQKIASYMDHALEEEAAAVRDGELLVRAAEEYERAEMGLRLELGREAPTAELAEKLAWPQERTELIRRPLAPAPQPPAQPLTA